MKILAEESIQLEDDKQNIVGLKSARRPDLNRKEGYDSGYDDE